MTDVYGLRARHQGVFGAERIARRKYWRSNNAGDEKC